MILCTKRQRGVHMRFLIIGLFTVVMVCASCENKPKTRNDVMEQIEIAVKSRDYDRAVSVGESWLTANPSDHFVLNEVSTIYLLRASEDSSNRSRWVRLAGQTGKR